MPSDLMGAYLERWGEAEEDAFGWLQSLVRRFRYKPGWVIEVRRTPERGGPSLAIQFHAEDSRWPRRPERKHAFGDDLRSVRIRPYTDEDLIPITGEWTAPRYICEGRDEKKFWDFLHYCLREMELHELDEWFRVDGRLPFDPHKVMGA